MSNRLSYSQLSELLTPGVYSLAYYYGHSIPLSHHHYGLTSPSGWTFPYLYPVMALLPLG